MVLPAVTIDDRHHLVALPLKLVHEVLDDDPESTFLIVKARQGKTREVHAHNTLIPFKAAMAFPLANTDANQSDVNLKNLVKVR